ncbi:MAG: hypothetical protein HOV84_28805 [Streptomyces sp.]|nr:hypothetical protein [Streptomyces sp.]
MDPQLMFLAQAAVTALASAAGRDEWSEVRDGFLAIFDGDERADVAAALRLDTLADLVRDTPPESRDEVLAELVPAWEARLRLLLRVDPAIADRLRGFVEMVLSRLGGIEASGGVQVNVVQQSVATYTVLGANINIYGAGRDANTNG